jgi:hypothetical protein
MKLTASELAYVGAQGLYITEKCDGCGKILNQTVRYTISGKPEVYCSAVCRDLVFFGDRQEVMKRATPGKCAYCGGSLKGKKRGSIFCDDPCRKAHSRKIKRIMTREAEKSRTSAQSNQEVGGTKTADQGDCIAYGPQALTNDCEGVMDELVSPVHVEQKILGDRREQHNLGGGSHAQNKGWAEERKAAHAS